MYDRRTSVQGRNLGAVFVSLSFGRASARQAAGAAEDALEYSAMVQRGPESRQQPPGAEDIPVHGDQDIRTRSTTPSRAGTKESCQVAIGQVVGSQTRSA